MGRYGRIVLAGAFSFFLLVGCDKQISTPLQGNPTLPIRETSSAKYCKPSSQGGYQSLEGVIENKGFDGEHYFAEGGGCLNRPIREAWAVTHNGLALKWKDAEIKSAMQRLPSEEVPFLFVTHYQAGSIIKPDWKISWYHSVAEGTEDDPEKVLIVYKKEWGTSFIKHWEGNIVLESLEAGVTAFSMYNSISGTRIDEKNAVGGVHDLLDNFRIHRPDYQFLNGDE